MAWLTAGKLLPFSQRGHHLSGVASSRYSGKDAQLCSGGKVAQVETLLGLRNNIKAYLKVSGSLNVGEPSC